MSSEKVAEIKLDSPRIAAAFANPFQSPTFTLLVAAIAVNGVQRQKVDLKTGAMLATMQEPDGSAG
jgi:hypothetical protein